MKKEYIIIGLIIAVLSAYLVMHKKDKNNYVLPLIPEINAADIAEINLEKESISIVIAKKDGLWNVAAAGKDKNYPADQESITKMIDTIKSLKLSALVSESGNLIPYQLDDKNRINVSVKSEKETLRKFEIGKTAPSFRHTFVRLQGNNSVYHAQKSFRADFDKTIEDLRDKKVLSFQKNKIKSIVLKKEDNTKEFPIKDGKTAENKESENTKAANQAENKNRDKEQNQAADEKQNQAADKEQNQAADEKQNQAVESLLNELSDLKCHSFTQTDNKDEFKGKGIEEIAAITLKAEGDKQISLNLYKKDDKNNYPAVSSESPYPFLLSTYEGDDIISKIDDAVEIEKTDNSVEVEKAAESKENNEQLIENVAEPSLKTDSADSSNESKDNSKTEIDSNLDSNNEKR